MILEIFLLLILVLIVTIVVYLSKHSMRDIYAYIRKIGGGVDDYNDYWLFSGHTGFDYTRLKELMSERGLKPHPDNPEMGILNGELLPGNKKVNIQDRLAFVVIDCLSDTSGRDGRVYGIKAHVKNLNDSRLTHPVVNKAKLHERLPEFCAKTWPLENFKYNGGVYILRSAHFLAASGADIFVVSNINEFNKAVEFYRERKAFFAKSRNAHMKPFPVIVSEYISSPMLLNGKKFHVRMYAIGCQNTFKINRHFGKMLTAELPYVDGRWVDKKIHDTHLASTDDLYRYPEQFPMPGAIEEFNRFLDGLERGVLRHAKFVNYEESDYSYEIYGLDIMFRSNGTPVLIEINDKVGFEIGAKDPINSAEYFAPLCEWIWETIEKFYPRR